jgi:protein TonB
MAVPVGNTVATSDRSTGPANNIPNAYAGGQATSSPGTGSAFSPVSPSLVRALPQVVTEVRAPYPQEALRLQIEGRIQLMVGIDETGRVRVVKIIKGIGHGLDQAALKAMWKFRWKPAISHEGKPVAFVTPYHYTFTLPR